MTQKAKIYLFPKGHGGREDAFKLPSARLGIGFPGAKKQQQFGCEIRALDHSIIALDEFMLCEIDLMNTADALSHLHVGNDFRVYEGARLIGMGIWVEVDKY